VFYSAKELLLEPKEQSVRTLYPES